MYIIIALIVGVVFIMHISTTSLGSVVPHSDKCELSLCDCECYFAGETPEEKTGKICANNCLAWRNVSGCAYEVSDSGARCVKIMA